VLIVDDDPDVRRLVKLTLVHSTTMNPEFEEAASAHEAISKLHKQTFELIIGDLFMKSDSGLDLFAHLQEHPEIKSSFVMLTASPDSLTKEQREQMVVISKCNIRRLIQTVNFAGESNGW